ncbi:MAG TPA: DNA repair protein RecN [Spirochaetota bacterium]|nr:DNA repair protein RecN [Spirochaetota bacterium]
MLQKLHIKNFVLIEELTMEFSEGLNILTGETGAGKSILIDAISAILGGKVTVSSIRTGCDRAILEGTFDITTLPLLKEILDNSGIDTEDDFLVIKREIYSGGKGRCFANGTQIPIALLKDISDYLIVIHGQNEHVSMTKTSTHRELLDSYACNGELLDAVKTYYNELHDLKEKISSTEMDEQERNKRIDYLTFALNEIEEANLSLNEEEELKDESSLLSHAEKLCSEVAESLDALKGDQGVLRKLESIDSSLSSVSQIDPNIASELENIRTALYQLEDSAAFFRGYSDSIDFSPERLNEIEERLALISGLKKKYGKSTDEILSFADNCRNELDMISNYDYEQEKLKEIYRETVTKTRDTALKLSRSRQKAAQELEQKVISELNDLNMKGAQFKILVEQETSGSGEIEVGGKTYMLYPHGLDKIEFMLAANRGEALTQLRKAASGGEMSRIMLAIKKVLLDADIVDSLIFDEVDTGISGQTADIVGRKLHSLAERRQVFVITHLAQIAAMSDSHYIVQKQEKDGRTRTTVNKLSIKEKIREVARMLAGNNITETTLLQAQELIENR